MNLTPAWVYLSPMRMREAIEEAEGRQRRAIARGRRTTYGQVRNMNDEISGACAESAFAGATGGKWHRGTELDRHTGDVSDFHVRSTVYPHGHLPMHLDDENDWKVALVIDQSPWFRYVGWAIVSEVRRMRWWRTNLRAPCFMIPQEQLRDA